MKARDYCLLGLLGLLVGLGVANFQKTPGYMDAEYYYAGGLRQAQGFGFSEMLVWNYLGMSPSVEPELPQPSHSYWMPLTSILAAIGMWITGRLNFWAARLGFILLTTLIPVITAALAYTYYQRREQAWLAGLLAIFSGFYFPYLVTTDSFSLYMLLGGLFWLVLNVDKVDGHVYFPFRHFSLGLLAGGLHLSRADGVIFLFIGGLYILLFTGKFQVQKKNSDRFRSMVTFFLGYILIMGFWLLRNLRVFGVLLSPAGGRVLWMTEYDELFAYPASLLTPQHWWQSGLLEILGDRLWAASINLQTILAVQGQIFLFPLIIMGLWKLRFNNSVRWGVLTWSVTFSIMTFIFPYAGARGGFFHSGAAFQPLFWALAPIGLDVFLFWGNRVRHWDLVQARRVFSPAVFVMALALSGFIFYNRVIGSSFAAPDWNRSEQKYERLENRLVELGAEEGDIVMVNNPAGYYVASQRPAIVIPHGILPSLLSAAQQYQARYLLVEMEQVRDVKLFSEPGDKLGIDYLETYEGVRIYQFTWKKP